VFLVVIDILKGSPKISTSGITAAIIIRLLRFKVIPIILGLFWLYEPKFFFEQLILIVGKLDI